MKYPGLLILIFSCFVHTLSAQQYPIYNPDKPDIFPVWHRVADYAPVLRSVEAARLSPDGRLAVSASKFGYNLMVWRVADGALLWENKQEAEIECVVFSPDGKYFATGDENFLVKIWDSQSGKEVKRLEHDSALDGITWSHNGKLIAAGSEKGDVWLWNADTYSLAGKINVGSTVNSLDFSRDDQELVVCGNTQTPDPQTKQIRWGGFVKLIDVAKKQVIRDYKGPKESVKSVRLSTDEKYIATGGFDNTAYLFETATGKLVKAFQEGHKIEAVAFTADGNYLLTGGHQRKISFYRLSDMQLAYELPTPRTEYMDFTADGRLLLTAHEDSGLLSLYMMVSHVHRTPGLYQKIEQEVLNNRDIKKQ
jgi:WD40 repeat protein